MWLRGLMQLARRVDMPAIQHNLVRRLAPLMQWVRMPWAFRFRWIGGCINALKMFAFGRRPLRPGFLQLAIALRDLVGRCFRTLRVMIATVACQRDWWQFRLRTFVLDRRRLTR